MSDTFVASLVAWVASHGIEVGELPSGDLFLTHRQGVVYPGGRVEDDHAVIPATLKAARDWLGY